MTTIAFTGATGHLGALVAAELLKRTDPANLVALARDPKKAQPLADQGIEVRAFDYDQPGTLAAALNGVDRLLLVSGNAIGQRVPQHKAVIDAAAQAGVKFFAYTSFLHADKAHIIAVAPEHQETEKLLAGAPFDVALLRNGWYTENEEDLVNQGAATGTLLGSTGDGRLSTATRQDYAEAAAVVLTADVPKAATYELGADKSWSLADLAATITDLTGKPVQVKNVTADEQTKILTAAGLPEGAVGFLVSTDQAIAAGELEDPTPGTLSKLIGRPTTSLADAIKPWLS